MNIIFYISAAIAIFSTVMVITRTHAVHALLYSIASFLGLAVIFFLLGAPYIAALEIIIYAGAIIVLFIFVVMMFNLGEETKRQEKEWLSFKAWIGPSILCLILLVLFIYMTATSQSVDADLIPISPKEVGISLYTKYILGVEMVAMLLMSAAVGAYHVGKVKQKEYHRFLQDENEELD